MPSWIYGCFVFSDECRLGVQRYPSITIFLHINRRLPDQITITN